MPEQDSKDARRPEEADKLQKPSWLRIKLGTTDPEAVHVSSTLRSHGLHTVCEEANCPNKGQCWSSGTATFMILGDVCTRGCRFCAVTTASRGCTVRSDEPQALSDAISELNLPYVILTSVDRDDLEDRGSSHFARCVSTIRENNPGCAVEVLIPDYYDDEVKTVIASGPAVIAHNVESIRRLQLIRDRRASFDKSMRTLIQVKAFSSIRTKTSLMLGLGETRGELVETYHGLADAGVDILVMGQYLRPSKRHYPVTEYIRPETFTLYAEDARRAGIATVISTPLARTSYMGYEVWKNANHPGTVPDAAFSRGGCAAFIH